jgi:invasion protein IalB
MYRTCISAVAATLIGALASFPAAAQQRPGPPAAPPPPPPPPLVEPHRTTADFGDWTLRCERPEGRPAVCEVAQNMLSGAQPIAQLAIGRPAAGEPLRLTLLLPSNITLSASPRVSADASVPTLELTWLRCLPVGCLADRAVDDAALARLRAQAEPGRITYLDGSGREVILPFSPRGLAGALDALARQTPR